MRKGWWRLGEFLAVGSAVLGLAIVGLWVRSYWRTEQVAFTHDDPPGKTAVDFGYHLTSQRGVLVLAYFVDHFTDPQQIAQQRRTVARNRWEWVLLTGWQTSLGFQTRNNIYTYGTNYNWQLGIPHALPAAMCVPIPFIVFRHRLRTRRRTMAGQCPACGYDLRFSPERCPECGLVKNIAATDC